MRSSMPLLCWLAASSLLAQAPVFSRAALLQDARVLARTLEETHPDPYTAFGGRIAFQRAFQERLRAIPEAGMTAQGFFVHFGPFVARMEDGHTYLRPDPKLRKNPGPGLPLRLKVVGTDLVLTELGAGCAPELLGARLASLEGRDLQRLVARIREIRGCENPSAERFKLAMLLESSAGIQELLPEWQPGAPVAMQVRLADGTLQTLALLPAELPTAPLQPPTQVQGLPDMSKSSLGWSFLDSRGEVAILVINDCRGYRENVDLYLSMGDQGRRSLEALFRQRQGRAPKDDAELKASFPSALDTFTELARAMQAKGTRRLLVDLRQNTGGNSLIAGILLYVLQGPEGLVRGESGSYSIARHSPLLQSTTGDRVMKASDAGLPLEMGDYNFSRERAYREGKPDAGAWKGMFKGFPELEAETRQPSRGGIYAPAQILALGSARTGSSGFSTLIALHKVGAKLVGTPSSQAPNCFIDGLAFSLPNTKVETSVSFKASFDLPDDPVRGRMLPCDLPLTYERFKALGFDPNAEVTLALEAKL